MTGPDPGPGTGRLGDAIARCRRRLRELQAHSRATSVAAAVVRRGEPVYVDSVGLADAETGRAATEDTQYRIGSITKTFTAVLVLQLRDAGRLDLDDRLDLHLPDTRHGSVTLRQLLTHLSGLQREPGAGPGGEVWEALDAPERAEFLVGFEQAERVLPPYRRWHYSNLAYAVLGEVVARASGDTWTAALHERLLDPLQLRRTTVEPVEPAARGYLSDPYADLVHAEPPVPLRALAPAGQLWSTPVDLARWGAFLAAPDPAVLAPETLTEMRHLHGMADLQRWTLGWGLGLMLYRRGDRVLHGHGGAMPGFLAGLACLAGGDGDAGDDPIAATVLTNSGAGVDVEGLAGELVEIWLAEEPREPLEWRPGEPPPPAVAGLLGRWWSEGSEFVFSWRAGRLQARSVDAPSHQPPAIFAPTGEDRWVVASGREQGEVLRIVRSPDGSVPRMYWAGYPLSRAVQVFGTPAD